MFYSAGIFRTLTPEAASQVTLRELLRRGEVGEPGYIEVLQQRTGRREHQKIIVN